MGSMRKIAVVFLGLAALLPTGCAQTRHVPYGQADLLSTNLGRQVEVELSERYFAIDPTCVTVLPVGGGSPPSRLTNSIVGAFSRQANDRFEQVITGNAMSRLAREHVLDLNHLNDRIAYSQRTRCAHFLEIRIWENLSVYALVWTQKALAAEARLTNAAGDVTYWRARHVAKRRGGGLPLSAVGALTSAYEATNLQTDDDVDQSIADDLARRIIATLPDL